MRLIDADKLLEKKTVPLGLRCEVVTVNDINNAPTIGPESLRPKGEWKVYLGGKELMCTACQATFWDENGNGGSNFCPNCGADMRGEENER